MTSKLTPMLRQYQEIKHQHPGTLLFFRLGDFYELFFEDAILGARELEITLTARNKERGDPIPMCGVPYHAAQGYIAKLLKKGYRVALCDQVEDPKLSKTLVRREVVRVITPGTALDAMPAESRENIYLASVFQSGGVLGAAMLDVSTGEFWAVEESGDESWQKLIEDILVYNPKEILFPQLLSPLFHSREIPASAPRPASNDGSAASPASEPEAIERPEKHLQQLLGRTTLTPLDDWIFNYERCESMLQSQFGVVTLDGFGIGEHPRAISAAGAVLHYVRETQRAAAEHITSIRYVETSASMTLDSTTIRNLELLEAIDGDRKHSLISVLDETQTGMGGRLLRQLLVRPSINLRELETRLEAVTEFKNNSILRDRIRNGLSSVYDLERLIGKVNLGTANARDLVSLCGSIIAAFNVKELLATCRSSLLEVLRDSIDPLDDVTSLIARTLADQPPVNLSDGHTIRAGVSAELDDLRAIVSNSKSYLAALETRERDRTKIGSLKVRFNSVFGYYIEVSRANLHLVPSDYERRQTLVNAERFVTPELKEYESKILGAEEKILEIETRIFSDLKQRVATETKRVQTTARAVAHTDMLSTFAHVANRRGYCRPELTESDEIEIREGRHPVIEAQGERFIPNDVVLNNTTDRLLIVTGPNMGGKSVLLRQTALISILAQIGCYVPASKAKLSILDRIFTRVGASDSLARGRSTFMVEMVETANILNMATPRSLIVLDEIGRGTATFDGLSIAWAVAEYLHNHPARAAKTLFATHYHEMTELAMLLPGVRNFQMAVKEVGGEILFLRKLTEGSASKSYGIEVARIAGMPREVIDRAREILENLEANELDVAGKPRLARHLPSRGAKWKSQPSLFDRANEAVLEALRQLDDEGTSPEKAIEVLRDLKSRVT